MGSACIAVVACGEKHLTNTQYSIEVHLGRMGDGRIRYREGAGRSWLHLWVLAPS